MSAKRKPAPAAPVTDAVKVLSGAGFKVHRHSQLSTKLAKLAKHGKPSGVGDYVISVTSESGDRAMVMMSRERFDGMLSAIMRAAEDAADYAAIDRGMAGRGTYLPGAMVDRILAGESPWRVWREHRGFTLDQLAAKAAELGATVGKSQLSHIETGRSRPSLALAIAVAKALEVPLDNLTA